MIDNEKKFCINNLHFAKSFLTYHTHTNVCQSKIWGGG